MPHLLRCLALEEQCYFNEHLMVAIKKAVAKQLFEEYIMDSKEVLRVLCKKTHEVNNDPGFLEQIMF